MSIDEPNRPLHVIAAEIAVDWPQPNPHAVAYLECMSHVSDISDPYYCESSAAVVARFLANARCWRGAVARSIKEELRAKLRTCGW